MHNAVCCDRWSRSMVYLPVKRLRCEKRLNGSGSCSSFRLLDSTVKEMGEWWKNLPTGTLLTFNTAFAKLLWFFVVFVFLKSLSEFEDVCPIARLLAARFTVLQSLYRTYQNRGRKYPPSTKEYHFITKRSVSPSRLSTIILDTSSKFRKIQS